MTQKSITFKVNTLAEAQVKIWSETSQADHGDCLTRKPNSNSMKGSQLGLRQNDLTQLICFWDKMDLKEKEVFSTKYGHIGDLLFVKVDEDILRAAFEFWDPSYLCFSFEHIDLTPTIEEYSSLMGIEMVHPVKVHMKRRRSTSSIILLSKLLQINVEDIEKHIREKSGRNYLAGEFLLRFLQLHKKDDLGNIAFALALYGFVIFPRAIGYIDLEVIEFFERVQKGGINPVPSILAETFRSLNFCKSKGSLNACSQLLTVWLRGHLTDTVTVFDHILRKNPIRDFCGAKKLEVKTKQQWTDFLYHLSDSQTQWVSPYLPHGHLIFKCGDFSFIPLLGVWGGIGYTPLLVLRQFGIKQFIPTTHGLVDQKFEFGAPNAMDLIDGIVHAWKEVHQMRRHISICSVTPEYQLWASRRIKNVSPLKKWVKDPESFPMPIPEKTLVERYMNELKEKTEFWENENRNLRNQRDQLKFEVKIQEDAMRRVELEKNAAVEEQNLLKESNKRLLEDRGAESLQKRIKHKDENIASLTDEVKQLREKIQRLEKESTKQDKLQAAFERLKQDNQKLRNSMQEMISEYGEKLDNEQSNSIYWERKLMEYQEENEVKLKRLCEAWTEKKKDYESRLEDNKEELNHVLGQVGNAIEKAEEAYKKIGEYKEKVLVGKRDFGDFLHFLEKIENLFVKAEACIKFRNVI